MKNFKTQQAFLEVVRTKMPFKASMVDELSDLLQLSRDSTYRRINCKTSLSLDEAFKISETYKVSLDLLQQNQMNNERIMFSYHSQVFEEKDLKLHMKAIHNDFEKTSYFRNKKMINSAVDIPLFYYFKYENLAKFKLLYWDSSFLSTQKVRLDPDDVDKELISLGKKIYRAYAIIPSVEIWTNTTINSTLEHIQFCQESEMITKEWALTLYEEIEKLLFDLRENAISSKRTTSSSSFELYISDISLGNNVSIVHLDKFRVAYMSVNTFGILKTEQLSFINRLEEWTDQVLQKSTLISGSSEKQRIQFFNRLLKHVETYKKSVD